MKAIETNGKIDKNGNLILVDGGNPTNCLNKQQHLTKIGICWVAQ
ncbi:hypothetical protein [Okeania sp. KiyG1]|nr:hypothetical protein [Okeania sp. KiyG1]